MFVFVFVGFDVMLIDFKLCDVYVWCVFEGCMCDEIVWLLYV